jgi:SAM-dependent methyltransferase
LVERTEAPSSPNPGTILNLPTTRYWDAIAREWATANRQRLWREYCDQLNARLLRRWLPATPGVRLLKTDLFDEATATGGLFPALAAASRAVVGIDLSMVTLGRARARHQGLAGVAADVRRLPFAEQRFDLIVSNSTLDHFPSLAEVSTALRELRRVLRVGGHLLLTIDNRSNPIVAIRNALPGRLREGFGLVPYYVGASCGPTRLQRLVRAAGFEVEAAEALMHCPRLLAVLVANLLDRLGRSTTRAAFTAHLLGWELLARWPTRFLTGYFVALKAVRTAQPDNSAGSSLSLPVPARPPAGH